MSWVPSGFETLCDRVISDEASDFEVKRLNEMIAESNELLELYLEQLEIHAALWIRNRGRDSRERLRQNHVRRIVGVRWLRWSAAAVAAIVAGWFFVVQVQHQEAMKRVVVGSSESLSSTVTLVHEAGVEGLMLPEMLPGSLTMEAGSAVVKLSSGVELALAAPVSLEVIDGMQVRLYRGQMVANVPPWASGFTVNTPQLEIWDLGTIFGVSSRGRQDDVFVFKGSVQVNESDGNAVDLCVAGEGVRVERGELPRKIAAEWGEAGQLFASVAGSRALAELGRTFKAVDELHEMWLARYKPKPIEKKQEVKAKPKPKPAKTVSTGQVAQTKVETDRAEEALSENEEESDMRAVTNLVAATVAAATIGVANVGLAVPQVSGVQLSQRDGTRVIDISYNLAGDGIVTLSIETNGVSIGDQFVTHLTGDVNKVVGDGTGKKIIWNAGFDWPEMEVEVQARVTAWSEDAPPLYCAIDVTKGVSAEPGEYPVYYYPSEAGVPGGVTNHLYKTTMILMRAIGPTGIDGYNMGSPTSEYGRSEDREAQVKVVLNASFYMGIYQVTQQQWDQIVGGWPGYFNHSESRPIRPVERVPYDNIRGKVSDNPTVNWPHTERYVNPNSFLGRLRTRTGLNTFDLPTEAQWEWACRAGTTGSYNVADKALAELGRYGDNGGSDSNQGDSPTKGTAIVGSYLPNAWGLYDMHGNVYEWCLDWFADVKDGGEDPAGATSGSERVCRGGVFAYAGTICRSAYRHKFGSSADYSSCGFRLVRNLP